MNFVLQFCIGQKLLDRVRVRVLKAFHPEDAARRFCGRGKGEDFFPVLFNGFCNRLRGLCLARPCPSGQASHGIAGIENG